MFYRDCKRSSTFAASSAVSSSERFRTSSCSLIEYTHFNLHIEPAAEAQEIHRKRK